MMGQNHNTCKDESALYHASTHTRTRKRSILQPMRRSHEDRPPDASPRVAIPNTHASPISTPQPSITSKYEPIARRTRYRSPHTMDQPPPRVNKTTDTSTIANRKSSQTAAMTSVITSAQAAQKRYPAKFIQSLEMPVLDKTSG